MHFCEPFLLLLQFVRTGLLLPSGVDLLLESSASHVEHLEGRFEVVFAVSTRRRTVFLVVVVVVCSSIVACTRLLPIVIVVVIVRIAAKVEVGF